MRKSQRFIYSTGRDIRVTVSCLSLGDLWPPTQRAKSHARITAARRPPSRTGVGAPSPLTAAVRTCSWADHLQAHLNPAFLRRFWFSRREQGFQETRRRPRPLGVGGVSVRPATGEGSEGGTSRRTAGGLGGQSWDKSPRLLNPRRQPVWRESQRKVSSRTGDIGNAQGALPYRWPPFSKPGLRAELGAMVRMTGPVPQS